ncbi:hypothetical protein OF83DRAFT_1248518 [Amylostereum chailletii]|nr:hypothetical protein OF83DRAFT_1248518 [Amylostereum chailletii]
MFMSLASRSLCREGKRKQGSFALGAPSRMHVFFSLSMPMNPENLPHAFSLCITFGIVASLSARGRCDEREWNAGAAQTLLYISYATSF